MTEFLYGLKVINVGTSKCNWKFYFYPVKNFTSRKNINLLSGNRSVIKNTKPIKAYFKRVYKQ